MGVIPKLELSKVAVKVLPAAVMIDALHAALEDGERALNGVGVDRAVVAVDVAAEAVKGAPCSANSRPITCVLAPPLGLRKPRFVPK